MWLVKGNKFVFFLFFFVDFIVFKNLELKWECKGFFRGKWVKFLDFDLYYK